MRQAFCILLVIAIISCNQTQSKEEKVAGASTSSASEIKAGGNKLILVDGKYNVWTKRVGDGKIKILLLHGGPGFTHDYMECMEDFFPKEGIEFYYYDQLGAGNSDMPSDTSLWNLSRFTEEVEQVRRGLGLENFYLFGHSWGSMLAMEYLHKYQDHVKAAVLSNMVAGFKSYLDYTVVLKNKFFTSEDIRTYDSLDKLGLHSSPAYQELLMTKLYSHVMCQLKEWPEPLMRAFKKANMNIYAQMQGVDEFHVTGNLKDWEFWDKLKDIKTPTLVIGGMNDEMNPEDMKKEGRLIPNSRTYLCPVGSHMSMYDDQQNYFRELIKFLKEVDTGTFQPDKK